MNVLVLGCKGFVGSNIMERLFLEDEINVYGVDNLKFGSDLNGNFYYHNQDVADLDSDFLNQHDVMVIGYCSNIIYAQTHEVETFKNNCITAIKCIQKFKGNIIYLSTASVYNQAKVIPTLENSEIHTTNAYDSSKFIIELYLQERGNFTTMRLSNVFGRYQRASNQYAGVVAKFIDDAINYRPIKIIGNGKQSRDFTHVEDVVDAVIMAIKLPAQNIEINIASGVETTINQLAMAVYQSLDKVPKFEFIPKRMIDGIDRRCLDVTRARKMLGWQPKINLQQGLSKTVNWIKSEMI